MKNLTNKIKTFFVSHKIVSIVSSSVLALAIVAGVTVGVMMNKNNKINTNDSTFSAKGSFGETTGNPDAEDAKKDNESKTSSTESTSAVSDASQAESQASDPAVTQTPADTKQNSSTALKWAEQLLRVLIPRISIFRKTSKADLFVLIVEDHRATARMGHVHEVL